MVDDKICKCRKGFVRVDLCVFQSKGIVVEWICGIIFYKLFQLCNSFRHFNLKIFTKKKFIPKTNTTKREKLTSFFGIEICLVFLNRKVVFCILSRVSQKCFELIDTERDEDFSMH